MLRCSHVTKIRGLYHAGMESWLNALARPGASRRVMPHRFYRVDALAMMLEVVM